MAASGYTSLSLYHSSTPSAVPTAGNLVAGELAINTADGKLFYKNASGIVQNLTGISGGSGVSGYSGFSGATGTSGFSGATGSNGSTGASGFSGYSGAAGGGGSAGLTAQLFLSNGTFTVPAGVSLIKIICIGGGGACGYDTGYENYAGYGGYAEGYYTVSPGGTYSVTVGAGGAGQNSSTYGNNGGASSFSTIISATGGQGQQNYFPGANGVGINGTVRNINIGIVQTVFVGTITSDNNGSPANRPAQTWNINSSYSPGSRGAGWGDYASGAPGWSGLVLVEW
jgi:hypothetical protein